MRLTIDIGNSATKMALWDGDRIIGTTVGTCADALRLCDGADVSGVIICAVRPLPDGITDAMAEIAPVTLLTHTTPIPLVNAYASPHTLGSDRLAAAIGAASLAPGRELLVVDLGTAATFDHVSADGRYTGGNIAPGLRLRLESLHSHTSRLPLLQMPHDYKPDNVFGNDTASAMLNGALLGIASEIAGYRSRMDKKALTVLTGGDAPLIAPLLEFESVTDPHLVGRGLNLILIHNEK